MARIRELLAQLADQFALTKPLLFRARRRYKANRKRAFRAHNQKLKAQIKADRLRGDGHPAAAARADKDAARAQQRELKNHGRAQFWLGRVKTLVQRVHGLETRQAELEAELKQLSMVTIKGDKATGGTKHQRLKAVALASAAACASGRRRNFYSQPGAWDVDHCITGERSGFRSDCSQWVTSVYRSCGLSDPNGQRYTGGYTGTLVANGREIRRSELKPGDLVLYGPGTAHHVELYVGPGEKTVGHGSAAIDAGVIDLFGDSDYRVYRYI